jgi:hypothetical protein
MATLYDASLDALATHAWNLALSRFYNITSLPWDGTDYYSSFHTSNDLSFRMKSYDAEAMEFDHFDEEWYSGLGFSYGY